MKNKIKPIGLLGGTFNPIHDGHLAIASHVLKQLDLSCVEFIPSFQPPHREKPIATPVDRLAMVELATKDNPDFIVNDFEIEKKGISYTSDTLTQFRNERPEQPFCTILGSDAFAHFNEWHDWEKILTLTHLVIINRANKPLPNEPWITNLFSQHKTKNPQDLHDKLFGYIYLTEMTPVPCSATSIRKQVQHGDQKIDCLRPAVLSYILAHGIYA